MMQAIFIQCQCGCELQVNSNDGNEFVLCLDCGHFEMENKKATTKIKGDTDKKRE